jgi:type I restriction enzyme S subunit
VLHDNIIIGGDLNVLRPKLQNGKYLSYLLSNKKRFVIARYAQGDSIVHLYGEKIKNINIELPTINEQEKVSKLLELLNRKIELQQRKIEALKIYKKGLMQKYFESKNGKKIKMSEILEEVINKTTENNQYDVISSTKEGLFLQSEYFNRSIASDNNIGYKILKKNQIVLSPQNLWMGNINYNNKYEIGMVSPSYKIFNINKKLDKDYIANLLKTNKAIYYYTINSEQGASIVRRNLNIESFYEINFVIPNIAEQNKKGRIINEIAQKIEKEEKKYQKLDKLKKGLLQKMFI